MFARHTNAAPLRGFDLPRNIKLDSNVHPVIMSPKYYKRGW